MDSTDEQRRRIHHRRVAGSGSTIGLWTEWTIRLKNHLRARQLSDGAPGGRRAYVHGLYEFDASADSGLKDVTIKLKSGETVSGEIVDKEGKPVDNVLLITRFQFSPLSFTSLHWRGQMEPTRGGRYILSGLQQGKTHSIHFLNAEKQLGATKLIRPGDDSTVTLIPCGSATARLVDADGRPHQDRRFSPEMVITPGTLPHDFEAARTGELAADQEALSNIDRLNHWEQYNTDSDGQIVFPALIPGATYRLVTSDEKGGLKIFRDFTVESGKTLDLGEFQLPRYHE